MAEEFSNRRQKVNSFKVTAIQKNTENSDE